MLMFPIQVNVGCVPKKVRCLLTVQHFNMPVFMEYV